MYTILTQCNTQRKWRSCSQLQKIMVDDSETTWTHRETEIIIKSFKKRFDVYLWSLLALAKFQFDYDVSGPISSLKYVLFSF